MSAAASKTLPPPAVSVERDLVEEQRALTLALTSHEDPHIRLLAHISERQLAFHELLSEFRNSLSKNTTAIEELTKTVQARGIRQDEHERQYPLNSGAHPHEARHTDAE